MNDKNAQKEEDVSFERQSIEDLLQYEKEENVKKPEEVFNTY